MINGASDSFRIPNIKYFVFCLPDGLSYVQDTKIEVKLERKYIFKELFQFLIFFLCCTRVTHFVQKTKFRRQCSAKH